MLSGYMRPVAGDFSHRYALEYNVVASLHFIGSCYPNGLREMIQLKTKF